MNDRLDNIYVEKNGVYNHWGVWVDPNVPITGVVSNNQAVQFISDECMNGIDLDWENHVNSKMHMGEHCECYDYWESFTWLIGDWIKDPETGLYDHDPEGEYAAIVGEIYIQVIFSKYTRKSALCSPCYPGQGDNETDGDFISYDLPSEAYTEY